MKFINIKGVSIDKSDIKGVRERVLESPPFTYQLIIELYSASSPSKNIFINYETKEEAVKDHNRINDELNAPDQIGETKNKIVIKTTSNAENIAKVFISYSDENIDKVGHLRDLLLESNIEPIIIAAKKEPLITLSHKVQKGIEGADYFVPILTKESIHTQWINQEIGYAQKLELDQKIKIIPIIEKSIMNVLRGFIHNQIDLPFGFEGDRDLATANYYFKKTSKELVEHIKDFLKDNSKHNKRDKENATNDESTYNEIINNSLTEHFLKLVKLALTRKPFDDIQYGKQPYSYFFTNNLFETNWSDAQGLYPVITDFGKKVKQQFIKNGYGEFI